MISPANITQDRIVVDTDVVSYIFRDDERAKFFEQYFVHRSLAVSFATVGELYYGAFKADWPPRSITRLETALKNYVVLPYDVEVARHWGRIRAEHQKQGHDIGFNDCWIAATALKYGCALATNNLKDFECTSGLTIISPGLASQPPTI